MVNRVQREITGTGWLSLDGEFVPCKSYAHSSTADEIVNRLGLNPTSKYQSCDDTLLDHGWIKVVYRRLLDSGYGFSYNYKVPHTDIQISMIKDFAEKDDVKLSSLAGFEISALTEKELEESIP